MGKSKVLQEMDELMNSCDNTNYDDAIDKYLRAIALGIHFLVSER